jgi:hypothetical protein
MAVLDTTTCTFLELLHRGGSFAYWWTLDQVKTYTITRGPRTGQQTPCKRSVWWPVGKPAPLPHGATEHVYFGVHPAVGIPRERSGRNGFYTPRPEDARLLVDEIAAINCLFAEFDAKDFALGKPGALTHITQLELSPSVVIDSGGGYHAYWLLDEPTIVTDANRAAIKDLQYRWVQYVESDDEAKDLARVLRVPGRPNVKPQYAPNYPIVAFVRADFDRVYTLDTLDGAIPPTITTAEPRDTVPFVATTGDHSAYVQAAYGGEIAAVLRAPQGQKHHTLRNAAIKLGSLLWTSHITEREITDGLQNAAERNACDVGYAHRTIADGIAYGNARPRTIADRQPRTNGYHRTPAEPTADDDTPPADQDTRPAIDRTTIDLPTIMPLAWDAVITANEPPLLFRRAGELARLERTEDNMLVIKTVDTRRMAGILARAARWVRVSTDKHDNVTERETVPPPAIIDDAMVNMDLRIPALTRIVHAPSFTDGDLLLSDPGYHPSAKIYYDPGRNVTVPPIPATPTDADLARAKSTVFDDLLIDFPFVSDADRAHAVALLLLPFVRELISGPTPLHLIEAPTMGTGKGLLAEMLLFPALGVSPTAMTEAATDEEWGKVITSNLLMAPTAIYIDNLNRMLASGKLAAALTAREYSDRVLGSSEQVSLPVRCVWVATANNPTLSTEISRRCIRIRIDPRLDEPWKRAGFRHVKLRSWVESNRGQLIWATLILCRYGLQHGAAGPALGSYESWSDVMGQILHGAGIPGFLGNLDVLYARADAEGNAWRGLLGAWWEQYGDEGKTAGDLYPLLAEVEADTLINGRDEIGRKKSFGKALARVLERVFTVATDAGSVRLQITDGGISHKVRLWKLASVETGGFGGVGGLGVPAPARDHVHNNIEKTTLDIGIPPIPTKPPGTETDPAYRDIGFLNRAKERAVAHPAPEDDLFSNGVYDDEVDDETDD